MIKNYMELKVEEMLSDILKKHTEICKCEKCVDDIKAIALNKLKPMYFSTERGSMYLKLKSSTVQSNTDILREITRAIEIVSENLYHKQCL